MQDIFLVSRHQPMLEASTSKVNNTLWLKIMIVLYDISAFQKKIMIFSIISVSDPPTYLAEIMENFGKY